MSIRAPMEWLKSYCRKGTKLTLIGLQAMFWAGLVASAIMGGSSDGAAAGEAAFQKTLAERWNRDGG